MNKSKRIINACKVYSEYKLTGESVRVAVLDTGIFPRKEFNNRIIYFKDFIKDREAIYDDNGHGTHVAGIIGAGYEAGEYSGLAPKAELIILKVLDEKGEGKTKDVLNALNWIIENYKRYNIKLVNFSIGFSSRAKKEEREKLLEKIEEIWDFGLTVVVASGNNGPKKCTVTTPGISKKVITVGALGEGNFSGKGPTESCVIKPEILAPGTNILSLRNAFTGLSKRNGTSMATPMVTGALALALEGRDEFEPIHLKMLLYETVREIAGKRNECWGLLDVDEIIRNR